MDAKVKSRRDKRETRTEARPQKTGQPAERTSTLVYQPGFGNHFVTEVGRPARCPSAATRRSGPRTASMPSRSPAPSFTTARAENRRTWTYRIRPSVVHRPYARIDNGMIRSAPFNEVDATPTQLRWSPLPIPQKPTDFVEGIVTLGGNGDVATQVGMAVHIYAANRSMTDRYFYNADGEMLIVPQQGRARFVTELGVIEAAPRRDRGHPARLALPRRAAGRPVARLHLRELRRRCCGCRSSARSAPTALPMRAISQRRSPPTRTRRRRLHPGREIPGQPVGGGDGPLAAQRGRVARQSRALQIRPGALQRHRHDQFRSSRSVDLQRAHGAVRYCPAPPTSIS